MGKKGSNVMKKIMLLVAVVELSSVIFMWISCLPPARACISVVALVLAFSAGMFNWNFQKH